MNIIDEYEQRLLSRGSFVTEVEVRKCIVDSLGKDIRRSANKEDKLKNISRLSDFLKYISNKYKNIQQ